MNPLPILVTDAPGTWAVQTNGPACARWLGYEEPTQTVVTKFEAIKTIAGATGPVFEAEAQSSLLSAIGLQTIATYRGVTGSVYPRTDSSSTVRLYRCSFDYDDLTAFFMERYMGETVWGDADDPSKNNHPFVRMLRAHGPGLTLAYYFEHPKQFD